MKFKISCLLTIPLLFTACVNLEPQPDDTLLIALGSELTPSENVSKLTPLYVGRVQVPGFLDGNHIQYRSDDDVVRSFDEARWTENLSDALPRALAAHLQSGAGANVPAYYPWPNPKEVEQTLSVQFERFSGSDDGVFTLVARWQIESAGEAILEGRHVSEDIKWDGRNLDSYLAAMNAGLSGLAAEISTQL